MIREGWAYNVRHELFVASTNVYEGWHDQGFVGTGDNHYYGTYRCGVRRNFVKTCRVIILV
jgi:hypothetical protein